MTRTPHVSPHVSLCAPPDSVMVTLMGRPIAAVQHGISRRTLVVRGFAAALALSASNARAEAAIIRVGYLRWTARRPMISLLDKPAQDNGLAGASLAMSDNNTTGRFINQQFELIDVPLETDDDLRQVLDTLAARNVALVLTDVPAYAMLILAAAAARHRATLFNVGAPDDALRQEQCRANVIHVAPSRRMLTDALGQYLVWKKWTRWVLAFGSHPDDALLADAYRQTAKRFGARIVKEIQYQDSDGARQTDSGVVETQALMPVFTQGLPDYDVLVAADENEVFAGYLPYRTWDARPVAGSAGLRPVTWDSASDSWGGAQVQDRFTRMFHRPMTQLDMQAWTACRMIGEAASRVASADPAAIVGFIKGPDFAIAAYKGEPLSVRDWDLQVRQPILLSDGRTVISVSPQAGFLHQVTDLDTLGVDRPEARCKLK
jgi:ABC transporter substrate binding protein (PQQ-dependent alcohol dehydrogenase system)